MIARFLMVGCAAILLTLGGIHLVLTFFGSKLEPRDPSLQNRMTQVSPTITSETTMWKIWTGVNATHSMALLLFGLVYGYLALSHDQILFASPFLLAVGVVFIVAFVVLGKFYFFSVPLWGLSIALAMYLGSIAASRA